MLFDFLTKSDYTFLIAGLGWINEIEILQNVMKNNKVWFYIIY